MAFGDDFAAALGGSLGVSVDPALFDPPEATTQQLSGFKSFIDGLDQASLASLDAVNGSSVDVSQASTQAAISWWDGQDPAVTRCVQFGAAAGGHHLCPPGRGCSPMRQGSSCSPGRARRLQGAKARP
jgi:hypothetical protein